MRRAFDDEPGTNPDRNTDRKQSDKTDPEIELAQIEAEIAAAKGKSSQGAQMPVPIRMGRFYDAMRRAFTDEAETKPDLRVQRMPSDKTDPEIELAQIEAEIAGVKEPRLEVLPAPVPIRPVDVSTPALDAVDSKPIKPSYERIIQRLLGFRGGRRHCVILVASAVPGDGASTVARNLALALGQSQNGRVVLVDANLRQPNQHGAFQINATGGFADVLRDEAKLSSVLRVVPRSGLTVLPAGDVKDGASQLITVPAVQKALTSLHSQFDWVIIDGPAVTTLPRRLQSRRGGRRRDPRLAGRADPMGGCRGSEEDPESGGSQSSGRSPQQAQVSHP